MNKLKNIGIIILLTVLTCCVVFAPQLLSRRNEKNLLNKTAYRNYSIGSRPKLTSEQVARLYCSREININSSPLSSETGENETAWENVIDLVEMLFSEDKAVLDSIIDILTYGSIGCFRNSVLIKIDNQPIALNFVDYNVKNEDGYFTILYEEKTKTIIRLTCDILEKKFEVKKDTDMYINKALLMIKNYFEKELSCKSGEYFFSVDALPIDDGPKGYFANIVIGCELMPYPYDDKEMDQILNN